MIAIGGRLLSLEHFAEILFGSGLVALDESALGKGRYQLSIPGGVLT